jgi:hypothetical protein
LKKWEENRAHCNMVHGEPCENKKKDEEVDVRGDKLRRIEYRNGIQAW